MANKNDKNDKNGKNGNGSSQPPIKFIDIPFEKTGVRGGLRRHMLRKVEERDGHLSKSLAKSSKPVVKYYTELSKQGDIPSQLRLYTKAIEPLTEQSFVMASNIEHPESRIAKEYVTPIFPLPDPKKDKKYTLYNIHPAQRSWVWYPDMNSWGDYYPAEDENQIPFLKAARTNEWELPFRKLDFQSTVLAISGTHTIQLGVLKRMVKNPYLLISEAVIAELSSMYGVIVDSNTVMRLKSKGYSLDEIYSAHSAMPDAVEDELPKSDETYVVWHKSYGKIGSFRTSEAAFAALGYKRKYVSKKGYAPAGKHLWVGKGEEVPDPIKFSVAIGTFKKKLALKYCTNSQNIYEILAYSLVYRVPSDLLASLTGYDESYILKAIDKAKKYLALDDNLNRNSVEPPYFPIDIVHLV